MEEKRPSGCSSSRTKFPGWWLYACGWAEQAVVQAAGRRAGGTLQYRGSNSRLAPSARLGRRTPFIRPFSLLKWRWHFVGGPPSWNATHAGRPTVLPRRPGLPWLASQRTLLSGPSGCRDSNPTAMFLPSSAPFPHLFQPHPLTTQALQRPAPAGAREHYSKWLGFCQPDLEAVGPDEGGVPPAFPICLAMFFSRHCAEWCRLSRWVDSPASIGSISRVCVWARRAPICPCSVRTRAGILPARARPRCTHNAAKPLEENSWTRSRLVRRRDRQGMNS